jgi:HD superfamily phosphohydrolase
MAEFVDLDDVAVNHCFKVWTRSDDEVLARLCRGLLYRGLYKTVDLSHLADGQAARAVYARAETAVAEAGGDPAYDLFYDEPADTSYEPYESTAPADESDAILVKQPDGRLTRFSEISSLPQALNQRLMFRRIHAAAAYRQVVANHSTA